MKIGIVGSGQVGATAAYSMMMRRVGSEIVLVDRKADLAVVDGVLDTAEEAVKTILQEGPAAAMNRFNRKEE